MTYPPGDLSACHGAGKRRVVVVVWLVNRRAFEPDLDCLPLVNVADDPTRFEHDPLHGVHRFTPTALRYLQSRHSSRCSLPVATYWSMKGVAQSRARARP